MFAPHLEQLIELADADDPQAGQRCSSVSSAMPDSCSDVVS